MNFTQADFIAMQARLQKNTKQPQPPITQAGCTNEAALHNRIIEHCKMVGWIYFHGSTAVKTARTVGEPDFTILANKGRVFFIECKTRIGKLSPEQMGMKIWAEKLGHTIHVIRSFDEFADLLMAKSNEP